MKSLHELNVEGLEGVAGGGDEVQARVDTGVGDLAAIDSVLLLQVSIEAALNGLQDRLPAMFKRYRRFVTFSIRQDSIGLNQSLDSDTLSVPVLVVDKVAESRSVDNVKLQTDAVLLNIGVQDLDADGLGALIGQRDMVLGRIQGCVEQSVDKGRLAKSGLAYPTEVKMLAA